MSTLSQRHAAVTEAMEKIRTGHWPAYVEWMDFEEGELAYRVDRDGRDLVVGVVVVLVRGDEVIRHEESHRFPGATDPEQVAANVLRRLKEVHDAVHGSEIPEEGVGSLVRSHRLQALAKRAYLHGDETALLDFLSLNAAHRADAIAAGRGGA